MNIKTKTVLTVILCSVCLSISTGQQNDKKKGSVVQYPPSYTLQFNFNFDRTIPELSAANGGDERSEYIYQGKTFGGGGGFGGSIVSKIRIDKEGMFRFDQAIAYNRILSFPYDDIKSVNDVGKADYNVFSGAIGTEYNFMLARNVRAYLGAEINASMINGDLKVWFQRVGNPLADSIASYSVANSFRMGYGINMGSEYILNKNIGLNLGIKYSSLNAFIKNAEGSNEDAEFKLRDDNNASLIFAGKKSFSFFSISGGINLYFGVKDKK